MYGGKISATDLNILLDASYEKTLESKDDYEIDKELSNEVSRVFRKKGTDEVFVVHTGSKDMRDVLENYGYITRGYYSSGRLSKAREVQKKAEEKYGSQNISTLGHSKGGKYAEMLGKNTKEIITLNKPTHLTDLLTKVPEKQTDIKSSRDPVSFLRGFQRGNSAIVIDAETNNPISEHTTSILKRKQDEIFGTGNYLSRSSRVRPADGRVAPAEDSDESVADDSEETKEPISATTSRIITDFIRRRFNLSLRAFGISRNDPRINALIDRYVENINSEISDRVSSIDTRGELRELDLRRHNAELHFGLGFLEPQEVEIHLTDLFSEGGLRTEPRPINESVMFSSVEDLFPQVEGGKIHGGCLCKMKYMYL